MERNRIASILQNKRKGRRIIGRPRKRWRNRLHPGGQGTGTEPNPSELMMMMKMAINILQTNNGHQREASVNNIKESGD